jgi:hypothetical protein
MEHPRMVTICPHTSKPTESRLGRSDCGGVLTPFLLCRYLWAFVGCSDNSRQEFRTTYYSASIVHLNWTMRKLIGADAQKKLNVYDSYKPNRPTVDLNLIDRCQLCTSTLGPPKSYWGMKHLYFTSVVCANNIIPPSNAPLL